MEDRDRRDGSDLTGPPPTRRRPSAGSIAVLLALLVAVGAAMQWWGSGQERRQGAQLAALARPGDIRMVSSDTCVFCGVARRWMTEHRVAFDECFIERDAACQMLYAATGARGTPTLLVREQVQIGFDASRVQAALEAQR